MNPAQVVLHVPTTGILRDRLLVKCERLVITPEFVIAAREADFHFAGVRVLLSGLFKIRQRALSVCVLNQAITNTHSLRGRHGKGQLSVLRAVGLWQRLPRGYDGNV